MTPAGVTPLVAGSTLAQLCAGWFAVLPIAVLAIYGWRRGGFLATIAGLQVLGSFLAAVALAQPASDLVESLGCPAAQSLAVAYVLVFAVGIVGTRLAVGAVVPDGVFRLGPLVDAATGIVVGGGAGLVLGGAILVGWSMADMPAWFRLDTARQPFDSGNRALGAFARFASRGAARSLLLDGDPPAADADATGAIRASEPFADANRNGRRDAGPTPDSGGEPYLDIDGDGGFTVDMAWHDAAGDGRRSAGLRDCHRLAEWRRVRAMHPPRIDSAAAAEVTENTPVEEVVYQVRATDVDGDAVTFAIEPVAGDEGTGTAPDVVVDPASGEVRLLEAADFERAVAYEFVAVVTDATGLSTRQGVRIRVRNVSPAPSAEP